MLFTAATASTSDSQAMSHTRGLHMAIATLTLVGIGTHREKRGPMIALNSVAIDAHGLEGDHRARTLRTSRQVTVLSEESWQQACREIGHHDLSWMTRRANLLVRNITFGPAHVGRHLEIGSRVVLEITGETKPCDRMEEQVPGLLKALRPDWRAGVTCRVIQPGTVTIGMIARLIPV